MADRRRVDATAGAVDEYPSRGQATPAFPRVHACRGGVAGDRHRREHGDLHGRQCHAAGADRGNPGHGRAGRHRALATRRAVRYRLVSDLPRCRRARRCLRRRLRVPARAAGRQRRRRGWRGARLGRASQHELLRRAARAARGGRSVRDRRRTSWRSTTTTGAQPCVLAAAIRWRPNHRRPRGDDQRRSVRGHRRRGARVQRHDASHA